MAKVRRRRRRKNAARRITVRARKRMASPKRLSRRKNPRGKVNWGGDSMTAQKARTLIDKGLSVAEARKQARVRVAKAAAKKGKKKPGRKMTKQGALKRGPVARRTTGKHSASARRVLKNENASSSMKRVANAYMRARGVSKAVSRGTIKGEAGRLAKAYGLTSINPSMKSIMRDVKIMLPMVAIGGLTLAATAAAGMKAGCWLHTKLPATTPELIKRNAVPLATFGITLAAYAMLKSSKGSMQKWAGPVMFGGASATAVHLLIFSKTGQKIAQKLGVPLTVACPTKTEEGAKQADKGEKVDGLASYMTVSQYLGDFVSAGPQEAFGGYVANDFPVHTPGPGDNMSVHASLGSYASDMEVGPGASFYGRSDLGEWDDPALPIDEIGLEQTPGGTMITSAQLSGGLFSGSTAI